MNNQLTPLLRRYSPGLAVLLLAVSTPVFSQSRQPSDKTNRERLRQQDMSSREYQLRNFGTQPRDTSDRRQLEALMLQTEQDFNRILTLHNEIVRATASEQALDYSFISEATAEIKKRASRLQHTLVLGKSETEHKDAARPVALNGASLKDELIMLCKQIKSFVTNPVIETPGTVNAEQLEKARRDLADIVKFSFYIKKDADKLNKANN